MGYTKPNNAAREVRASMHAPVLDEHVAPKGRWFSQPRATPTSWNTVIDPVKMPCGYENYARLRAFPPQAVLGPCFSTGTRILFHPRCHARSRASCRSDTRRPVNGPDHSTTPSSPVPGVNAGPNTACGGKGRKRPLQSMTMDSRASTRHSRRVDAAAIACQETNVAFRSAKAALLSRSERQHNDITYLIPNKAGTTNGNRFGGKLWPTRL
jgi:hypothetical protein